MRKVFSYPAANSPAADFQPICDEHLDQLETEVSGNYGYFNRGLILMLIKRIRLLERKHEYEALVRDYYPDKITQAIANRMLELEALIFTESDLQSLVPPKFKK